MRCRILTAAAVLSIAAALRFVEALPFADEKDNCKDICGKPSSWDMDDGPCFDVRTEKTNSEAFEKGISILKNYYPFTSWKRLDWDTLAEPARRDAALADELKDISYVHSAIAKLVAAIPDGHMEYETEYSDNGVCGPEAAKLKAKAKFAHMGGGFGFTVAGLDHKYDALTIITSVTAGSKAAQAGLKIGDVVEAINGRPALDSVKAQGPSGWMFVDQNPSTTKNQLMEQFRQIVRAPVGTERNWSIANNTHRFVAEADDYFTYYLTNPVSLWYNVSAGEEIDPAWPIDPDCDDGCATIHAHMINNTEFGYIGLGEEDVKNINKRMAMALAALKGAKGIVLDLRANDGGTDHQGAELLEFFLPEGTAPRLYEKASYSNRLLAVAGDGKLRRYMNGTNPDDFGIVTDAVDSADGTIYTNVSSIKKYQHEVPGFEGPFTGPVVVIVNAYCDSTCEGIAKGFTYLPNSRVAITGFDGTTGCFGMSGGTIVMPGDTEVSFPFGRSLDANNVIQIDSDWTGVGGVSPTVPVERNSSNLINFVQQKLDEHGQCCHEQCTKPCTSGGIPNTETWHDVELDFALSVLKGLDVQ